MSCPSVIDYKLQKCAQCLVHFLKINFQKWVILIKLPSIDLLLLLRLFRPQAAVCVCFLACVQVEVTSTSIISLSSFWRQQSCPNSGGSLITISTDQCTSTSGHRRCEAKCNGRTTAYKDKGTSKFASRECMKSVTDFLKFLVMDLNEVISTEFRPAFKSQFSP